MKNFKPILAATLLPQNFDTLKFPLYVSPKLDGIRVIVKDGVAMTRSLKPVKNTQILTALSKPEYEGLDGEIIVGDPCDKMAYRKSVTATMKKDAVTDFRFYVFDDFSRGLDIPFNHRFAAVSHRIATDDCVKIVPHVIIETLLALLDTEAFYLNEGFEGIMIRSMDGRYKTGRSTLNEGILLKLKRFADAEAKITGFVERLHNGNESKTNELGYTERSTHKENMVPMNMLGGIRVRCPLFKEEFVIGTGYNDEERHDIWNNQERYAARLVKFKYFDYGGYDQPRFPVFLGFRDREDT